MADIMDKMFTRSLYTISATGMVVDGLNFDTMTIDAHSESIEFVSTVKNDKKMCVSLFKDAHPEVNVDSIHIDKCVETVYGMTLRDFLKYAKPVERAANGRVKELEA